MKAATFSRVFVHAELYECSLCRLTTTYEGQVEHAAWHVALNQAIFRAQPTTSPRLSKGAKK